MHEHFRKFKKKAWRDVIVQCVLAAVAAALLAVDVVLLPCKLNGVHLLWVFYVLIALGGFAVGGGIAFVCLRTSDEKIAKRLDAELHLQERVQTAMVFHGQESDMLDLQRADTRTTLGALPAEKLSFAYLAVAVILAVVLALGAIALPVIAVCAKADGQAATPADPVDPPRHVTDWEWQALDELIEYVKNSQKADAVVKTGMVSELEGLRNVLSGGVSQSGLAAFVQNTVTAIRNLVREANERGGVSEEQQTKNSEEETYVINKLYEIFELRQSGNDPSAPPDNPPDEENPGSPGNNTGTGELVVGGVPFFDPEKGYVSSGDTATRDEYLGKLQQAMLEGVISRSEWELIVATYFADLKDKEE